MQRPPRLGLPVAIVSWLSITAACNGEVVGGDPDRDGGAAATECGDGMCRAGESCDSCAEDCGACAFAATAAIEADVRVEEAAPEVSFGEVDSIAADLDPAIESYLRFRVSGVTSAVTRATLRLTVTNASTEPPALFVTATDWDEGSLTWSSRPEPGAAMADATAVAVGGVVEYDVTEAITGDGAYGFALVARSTDGFAASAREGLAPPELVLELAEACGDGVCSGDESCARCAADCGECQADEVMRFSTVGDHGSSPRTSAVLDLIPHSGDFFLSLGDLSYGTIAPERAWCDYVKEHIGADYPFAIVSGSHEAHLKYDDGLIDNFIAADCLPNRLPGVVGDYGKEFYLDYPAAAPLARLIAISPNIDFTHGGVFRYALGSTRWAWTEAAIDDARARGIPWVIVATHRNCISMGIKKCEFGAELFNFLIEKKVDVLLQGHDHNYQRSKQLAHGPDCAAIVPNDYDADCVVDAGRDRRYTKGAGSVLVINGMGGVSSYSIWRGDPEAPYFADYMTSETFGLARIEATANRLDLEFVGATGGDYTDHFSIVAP
jgi:hypothetical protein